MDKVSRDVAAQEIESWLDYKKINARKRESYQDQIDTLIDGVCDGALVLNADTHVLTHNLKFPLEAEVNTSSLDYTPRVKMKAIHHNMQGVKSGDADGRVCAYIATLAGKPKELIKAMDTEDYSIAQAVAIFFL